MRKLVAVVILVVLGLSPAFATENSLVFGPLTRSATFVGRVSYILAQQAPVVQVEAVAYSQPGGDTHTPSAICHSKRVVLSAAVAANPDNYAGVFASHLVANINITSAGALTGSGATLDSPAIDSAILAAVAGLWSTVAGCVTNP